MGIWWRIRDMVIHDFILDQLIIIQLSQLNKLISNGFRDVVYSALKRQKGTSVNRARSLGGKPRQYTYER